jgi:hypothetical protein
MKRLFIIFASALAFVGVVLTTLWFVQVSIRIENLELKLEQAQLRYQNAVAELHYTVLLNTSRQKNLEHVFVNSEGFRLTLEQIKSYNASMKIRWMSLPRHKHNSIGGK